MKTPQLKLHKASGVWYARFSHDGKDHTRYFSRDPQESQAPYIRWLQEVWMPLKGAARDADLRRRSPRFYELAELYLAHTLGELGPAGKARAAQYRSLLSQFIDQAGQVPAAEITLEDVEAHKYDLRMLGYAPRTINHTLKAVKRVYAYARARRYLGPHQGPDFTQLRLEPVPRPHPTAPGADAVHAVLARALAYDPRLVPWLALQYLAALRPSELVRLVHGQGHWVSPGVYAIKSKAWRETGDERCIPLSPEALLWLPPPLRASNPPGDTLPPFEAYRPILTATPCWKTWTGYSERVRQACGRGPRAGSSGLGGPRRLRAWASTHLRRRRVSRGDIEIALGHVASGSIAHYVQEDWDIHREQLSRLTLRCSPGADAPPQPPSR